MPYQIRKAGDKFEVIEKDTGKIVGTHPDEEKAQAQLSALYKNVPDATEGKSEGVKAGGEVEGVPFENDAPEVFVPLAKGAVKVGAMISAANKAKLKAAHDAIRELMPECCMAEKEEDEGKEEETEIEIKVPKSIDSAPGGKSEEIEIETAQAKKALPLFNYVMRLHLPYEEQFTKDVVAAKAVARDTIRMYHMLWGDEKLTDIETEFFNSKSDFWDEQLKGITRPLTYDHAQDTKTKGVAVIGSIEAFGDDDIGRWGVCQLKRNHDYRAMIDKLISQRALGGSSDSASQYVVRKSAGKAVWLAQWPWFASALTPTPAEPRMLDVGLPYWKSAGVDFARMGAPDGALKIPEALRLQAQFIKSKAGVP